MTDNVIPLQLVCEMARNLPCAPWLLPRLMQQLARPQTTAQEIENLIRLDAGLAAETLRLANSAVFAQARPCDTFTEAVIRLGFREIYRLATTKIVSRWLRNDVAGYGWEPGDLYRHSLTVAVAADLLAKRSKLVDAEIAYTGGLLHDVGKLALAYVCSDQFERIRQLQQQEQVPWRQAEHEMLGYDHTDVGGALLSTWGFPPSLVQVVCFYPRPARSAQEHRTLVGVVHAAKHLALTVGTGVGEEGYSTELDEVFLKAAGITNEECEKLLPLVIEGASRILAADAT